MEHLDTVGLILFFIAQINSGFISDNNKHFDALKKELLVRLENHPDRTKEYIQSLNRYFA